MIVVDNGSTDGVVDEVRHAFPDVEVISAGRNLGARLALGVARASTPYVAFSDDDSWWGAGAFDRAAGAMDAHACLDLVAGESRSALGGVSIPYARTWVRMMVADHVVEVTEAPAGFGHVDGERTEKPPTSRYAVFRTTAPQATNPSTGW